MLHFHFDLALTFTVLVINLVIY